MGPGCGTAMLGERRARLRQRRRPGSIGIVAAAGTGAQEAACLLDAAGVGVSQIVGVGGRDLSTKSAGSCSARRCGCSPPTTAPRPCCSCPSRRRPRSCRSWGTATSRASASSPPSSAGTPPMPHSISTRRSSGRVRRRRSRGARRRARSGSAGRSNNGSVASSSPCTPAARSPTRRRRSSATATRILDLGEEEYTQGRPHPMVDLGVRLGHAQRAVDDEVGCVLLDVVIGHGSHPDPASELVTVSVSNFPIYPRDRPRLRNRLPIRRTPPSRRKTPATAGVYRRSRPTPPRPRPSRQESLCEDRHAHVLGQAARRASCTRSRSPRHSNAAATTSS